MSRGVGKRIARLALALWMATVRVAPGIIEVAFAAPGAAAAPSGASGDSKAAREPEVTLTWKARNDTAVYGYLVYRGSTEEGPFRRVSAEIVHVNGNGTADINEYRFVDRSVEPGLTYYYYLDTIGLDGRKQRFSGVVAKTVAAR